MVEVVSTSALSARLAGLIWGEAKTGKTTWAMSLPGKKLLINFDPDGYLSVAHRDDIDILDLAPLPPGEQITEGKKAATYIINNKDKYTSVVVDSLTAIVIASLYDAIAKGVGKSMVFAPSLETPGLAAYGARNNNASDIVGKILRATAQTKMNCFFIAHSDDPEYDAAGKTIVQHTILAPAKVRMQSTFAVSEIYHLALASGNRRTVYLAPFGEKRPMGSRIFDTKDVPKFDLNYDIYSPDEGQPCSLSNIIAKFQETRSKLRTPPK